MALGEQHVAVVGLGVLVFAVRNLTEPTELALALALAAVGYAALAAVTARLVGAAPGPAWAWRAALMLVAGTGASVFLFPVPAWALLLGIVFCLLDLTRSLWQRVTVQRVSA